MGKVGKVIAGIGLIVTGAVIGVFTQNWTLAFAVASLGAGLLTQPKIPKMGGSDLNERTGAILENRVGGLQYLPVIYGTAKLAGVFADIRVDDNSTARKRLVLVPAFCHGSRDGTGITGIDEVWFDDRKAIDGTTVQSPFASVVVGQTPAIKYLQFEHHLGSSTQLADTRLTALLPAEWPTTAQGRGVCYSRLELWYDGDKYPGGIPTVQVKARGNSVYDPRDNAWKFSTNPALCIRDYILSPIYGMAVPEASLENQSFIDMANYCDELVNIPGGGTQKRFELNGWVDTSRSVEQNLAEMCTSCRGQVVNEGDTWRLVIRRARQPSGFKINERNTIEGAWQFILPGADLCPNVVRASYIDPSRNYVVDTVQWPEPGQANLFLSDDNSYEQRLEMDLPFTNNRLMAQQIGMTLMKESREAIGVVCTLREEGLATRVGELVEVTQPTPGWVDKVFDVAALMLTPDGQVRAVLIEYEPTVYDLDTQFAQPAAIDTNLPDPFTIAAPTALVLVSAGQELLQSDGGYIPRIRVTWTKSNDPFVDYYQIQARRGIGDTIEVAAPFASSSFTHSGLSAFDATKVWNDVLSAGDNAWHTDSAVAGAWLQLDCGAGITKEYVECRIFAGGGSAGIYDLEYSDNASVWTLATVAFKPTLVGLNSRKWASVGAHRYWRIKLTNTPGAGSWLNELQFLEGAWDDFGRVAGLSEPLVYVYPVTADESWSVRVRAVNKIGVNSSWLSANHIPVVLDPRPQVLSITLTNAHSDIGHIDAHTDIAHGDAGHTDAHTDTAHTDHTDHTDGHSDSHSDSGHGDSHGDFHGDHTDGSHFDVSHFDVAHSDHTDGHADSHTDGHNDSDHTDVAHLDFHSDHTDGTHSDIGHYDEAHVDHTDSSVSHTDVTHVDSHSDTAHSDSAHSDGHTDQTHSDGQFGVGIAIQADQDSASVKAVARKVSGNKVVNGGGETGTVGAQAPSWSFNGGNAMNVANDFYKYGSKSLKVINSTPANSTSFQDVALLAGKRYRIEGWIKTTSLTPSGGGAFLGVAFNIGIVSGITSFTIVEKSTIGADPSTVNPDCGIQADGTSRDWTYVFCRFIPTASGTIRIYWNVGYNGNVSGTVWLDQAGVFEDEPSTVDVRTQQAIDGRNVVIELIDMATGAQIQLAPGDMVRVGALAYSDVAAAGVEGPLALASVGLFNIAPVGTDKWVPS